MADPIWYFGPDWDLRPLVCPERDIEMPVERYGGVFQGLSGARTTRVTGLKQKFTLQLNYLTPSEYEFLEACNIRAIPGPFRLISPFKRNLLSRAASITKAVSGYDTVSQGVGVSGGIMTQIKDWPTGAPALGYNAIKVFLTGSFVRFDSRQLTPVTPGSQYTFSIYTKGVDPTDDARIGVNWFDKNRTIMGAIEYSPLTVIGNAWSRFTYTTTPPAGAYSARMLFYSGESTEIRLAAAQVESGSSATTWQIGGGAPRVIFDQLADVSPRFPYLTSTLTLLEA